MYIENRDEYTAIITLGIKELERLKVVVAISKVHRESDYAEDFLQAYEEWYDNKNK